MICYTLQQRVDGLAHIFIAASVLWSLLIYSFNPPFLLLANTLGSFLLPHSSFEVAMLSCCCFADATITFAFIQILCTSQKTFKKETKKNIYAIMLLMHSIHNVFFSFKFFFSSFSQAFIKIYFPFFIKKSFFYIIFFLS